MKKIILLISISLSIILFSCGDDHSVTNYNGGNADIYIDYITLQPQDWLINNDYEFQWFQEFVLDRFSPALAEEGTVIAYIQNQYGAWEVLPISTLLWTEDGTVYSEELWYSYNSEYIFFDFRNTHPYEPLPPANAMNIKLIILENWQTANLKKEVDINNHDEVIQALNLKYNVIDNSHSLTE